MSLPPAPVTVRFQAILAGRILKELLKQLAERCATYRCQAGPPSIYVRIFGCRGQRRAWRQRRWRRRNGSKEYDDIPGTFVFDAERSRQGTASTCSACR